MDDWVSFTYFISVVVLIFIGAICLGVYLHRKSTGKKAELSKELRELADKAMEARDDPNDPARFVP
jgi:hypothetical protein